ncbi:MAG TPA: transposase [Steroidobacteraceae bacterium]
MPRTSRSIIAGHCYHLINRGNNRAQRFHGPRDFNEFVRLMSEASDRILLPVIGACLMPNHVHLVVRPCDGQDVARWMHWLFATYSRRYHSRYGSTGRVWENRFKAFAIQGDSHLLIVLRYVERNAQRANLTERAEHWHWSSLNWRMRSGAPFTLAPSPIALPEDWVELVNRPHTEEELAAMRNCVNRQRPFGADDWVQRTAAELDLEKSLAPLGRPRRRARQQK